MLRKLYYKRHVESGRVGWGRVGLGKLLLALATTVILGSYVSLTTLGAGKHGHVEGKECLLLLFI
jgi:hypothetical protein